MNNFLDNNQAFFCKWFEKYFARKLIKIIQVHKQACGNNSDFDPL